MKYFGDASQPPCDVSGNHTTHVWTVAPGPCEAVGVGQWGAMGGERKQALDHGSALVLTAAEFSPGTILWIPFFIIPG